MSSHGVILKGWVSAMGFEDGVEESALTLTRTSVRVSCSTNESKSPAKDADNFSAVILLSERKLDGESHFQRALVIQKNPFSDS